MLPLNALRDWQTAFRINPVVTNLRVFGWVCLPLLAIVGSVGVCPGQGSSGAGQVALNRPVVEESADQIIVKVGQRTVLVYHKSVQQPPAGMDRCYRRSGYLHPICTPSGLEVTGDFAPGHIHQHGFFMAWVNTRFDGRSLDFWNQKKQTGQVSHSKVIEIENGDEAASFVVELLHQDMTRPGKLKTILVEQWRVSVELRDAAYFVIDLQSEQKNTADLPLELLQYRYGGLGLRGNEQWNRPEAKAAVDQWSKTQADGKAVAPPGVDVMGHGMLTSEGADKQAGNHAAARWVAMFGSLEGRPAGIAVLSHPTNFRAPQTVRLHPIEPYFSYAPVVDGPFKIEPGQTYRSRYRLIAFDGKVNPDLLNREWEDFSD